MNDKLIDELVNRQTDRLIDKTIDKQTSWFHICLHRSFGIYYPYRVNYFTAERSQIMLPKSKPSIAIIYTLAQPLFGVANLQYSFGIIKCLFKLTLSTP